MQLWSPAAEVYLRVCQPLLVEGAFGLNPDNDFLILLSGAHSLASWSNEGSIWKEGVELPLFLDYVDQDVKGICYTQMTPSARLRWLDTASATRIINSFQQVANNRFR